MGTKRQGRLPGRPKRIFRRDDVVQLRAEGMSWRKIAAALGIPVMTAVDAYRATPDRTKNVSDHGTIGDSIDETSVLDSGVYAIDRFS